MTGWVPWWRKKPKPSSNSKVVVSKMYGNSGIDARWSQEESGEDNPMQAAPRSFIPTDRSASKPATKGTRNSDQPSKSNQKSKNNVKDPLCINVDMQFGLLPENLPEEGVHDDGVIFHNPLFERKISSPTFSENKTLGSPNPSIERAKIRPFFPYTSSISLQEIKLMNLEQLSVSGVDAIRRLYFRHRETMPSDFLEKHYFFCYVYYVCV